MTYKEKVAKRKEFFSLKAYLYKKAQIRALKLQFRQARRNAKAEGDTLTWDDWVAGQNKPHNHEHHDHDHKHVHDEEPLVLHEDDLAQIDPAV